MVANGSNSYNTGVLGRGENGRMANNVKPIPDGFHAVTPYLVVPGIPRLMEFIKEAFGGVELHRSARPDGTVMHALMRIADSMVMMGEPQGESTPRPTTIMLYVTDTDATYRSAIQAGGKSLREPADQFYGDRTGGVEDPCGNQWWIGTHVEDVSDEEMARRMKAMENQPAQS